MAADYAQARLAYTVACARTEASIASQCQQDSGTTLTDLKELQQVLTQVSEGDKRISSATATLTAIDAHLDRVEGIATDMEDTVGRLEKLLSH